MDKPVQYLLVGYPYSGKTTLAKELVKKLGFKHINIDRLKWDMGYKDVGDDDVPDKAWKQIFNTADSLLIKYLKQGKNVANEYAWITKDWRERARKVAKNAGYETKLIYLIVEPVEIRRRWLANSKLRERFHWPKDEFERLFKEFEEPTPDENIIIFRQNESPDSVIDKLLSKK